MAAATDYSLEGFNPRKRPASPPSTPSTCSEPPLAAAAKRACPSHDPCIINYMHPHLQAATCCSQAEEDTDRNSHGDDFDKIVRCANDSETIGRTSPTQWADEDERLIREMMYSLEQAIGNNQHMTEDSSSCSSSPLTNTSSNYCATTSGVSTCGETRGGGDGELNIEYRCSELEQECGVKPIDDCSASIDEEIQAMLQQAEDYTRKIPNYCDNLDDCGDARSCDSVCVDWPSGADYPYDDDQLGLINSFSYPLVLDFDCFGGPFDCF